MLSGDRLATWVVFAWPRFKSQVRIINCDLGTGRPDGRGSASRFSTTSWHCFFIGDHLFILAFGVGPFLARQPDPAFPRVHHGYVNNTPTP